jgi:hypothetical protein
VDPAGNTTSCEVRRQLARQFAIAARLYAEAVVMLTRDPGTVSNWDYGRLREAAEQAQARSESTGRAFEKHVDSHKCA